MDLSSNIDLASAVLINQLQLEDTVALINESVENSGTSEGELSDTQLAIQMFREELEHNASMNVDRLMTASIARACQSDGELIITQVSAEEATEFMDAEVLAKLEALFVSTPTATDKETQDEAVNNRNPTTQNRSCVACHDTFPNHVLARAPCNHEYCRSCLQDLFQSSMKDETLFPPRCCRQPITVDLGVRIQLTQKLVKKFEAKKIEYDTPNRTYCSNKLCSIFLLSGSILNEKATCPDCETVTCIICKGEAHVGDCPEDATLQQVLAVAAEQGWQRCFNCHRLVELDTGCYHITCRCNNAFCYLCGEAWKTCECEQWDERRLLARANQVVARQPARLNAEQQEARVAAAVENLRDRHNCNHGGRWARIDGNYRCEECESDMPEFILECRQCHLRACARCRMNRL